MQFINEITIIIVGEAAQGMFQTIFHLVANQITAGYRIQGMSQITFHRNEIVEVAITIMEIIILTIVFMITTAHITDIASTMITPMVIGKN